MTAMSDGDRLRSRAKDMLELANRARCEKSYDFARLFTQLAAEIFERAGEIEGTPGLSAPKPPPPRASPPAHSDSDLHPMRRPKLPCAETGAGYGQR